MEEMEEKYLAIDRLENSGKRWTLDEMEQDLDTAAELDSSNGQRECHSNK